MLPRERVAKVLKGEKPDKLPIMVANSNTFICQYYGMTVREFLTNPDLCSEGNIRFTEEFEIDYNLCVNGYILYGCGSELGCDWKYAGNDFPGFIKGPLQYKEDLEKIKVPSKPTGYFKHYLEVIRRVNAEVGNRYHISVSILGPFAVACFFRGIQEALLDTIADCVFFHQYMKKCTDFSIYFGKQILSTGLANPILNEIFLTPEMIRPDTYHEMIAPYDQMVQSALGPQNSPNSLAAFMGLPHDPVSQKAGRKLYKAFFNGVDSVEQLKDVIAYRMTGMPFPASVSGIFLDSSPEEEILEYLNSTLNYLVRDLGLYPSISLTSVQAESPEKARSIAKKIRKIQALRDSFKI